MDDLKYQGRTKAEWLAAKSGTGLFAIPELDYQKAMAWFDDQMPTPMTDPKEQHTGIWRFPPLRLLRWIDNQGSPALTKLLVGLMLVVICWVASIFWQQIVAWIPFLGRLVAALRTELLLELWMLILCIVVPLTAFVWLRLRRVVIHSAFYRSPNKGSDVTALIRTKAEREGILRIPATNSFCGGDPDHGTPKTLTVDYSIWGRRKSKTVAEAEILSLN